jgi:hypothetical protein
MRQKSSNRKPSQPKSLPQVERNSFFIEELMFRNGWSRAFTYNIISRGILRTYKDGKRRRATAEAEREAIAQLERATAEGRAA